MTQPHRPRGVWGLIAAAVALVAPAIASASTPPAKDSKKSSDPQPASQLARTQPANLSWLRAVSEALSGQTKKEASEFEPPGKPPDRPPDKPGQHDPPNPPGKPPDRPPSNSNGGGGSDK